jgi:DNA-binding transcriptional regulator YbjK
MSEDRLDRLEKIVESNSKAIEAWANESIEFRNQMKATTERLEVTTAKIVDSIELLTQVVVRLDARQQDQENRITRIENT